MSPSPENKRYARFSKKQSKKDRASKGRMRSGGRSYGSHDSSHTGGGLGAVILLGYMVLYVLSWIPNAIAAFWRAGPNIGLAIAYISGTAVAGIIAFGALKVRQKWFAIAELICGLVAAGVAPFTASGIQLVLSLSGTAFLMADAFFKLSERKTLAPEV